MILDTATILPGLGRGLRACWRGVYRLAGGVPLQTALLSALLTTALGFGLTHFPGCSLPPAPAPAPSPAPDPEPAPLALPGSWLIGVTDNDRRDLALAAILEDQSLASWLKTAGMSWRVFDRQAQALHEYGYDQVLADAKLAPPAVLLLDSTGHVVRTAPAPATADALKVWIQGKTLVEPPPSGHAPSGHVRKLGYLPPSKAKLSKPQGGSWKDSGNPVLPRAQWRELDRRSIFGAADWILDQDGIGECVGCGSAGALRRARVLAGMQDRKLSPGCLYAQINGGQDEGAVIADACTALQKQGTCLYTTVGIQPIYTRQQPAGWEQEAVRFRVEECYHCDTFDEIVSALELGYLPVYGIMVGDSYENFDRYGVAGHASGPGNHCMCADGVKHLADGRWVLDNVNSWGSAWGPDKNGRCYLDEQHFAGGDQPDCYVIKTCTEDPQEPIKPPKPMVKDPPKAAPKTCACSPLCECGCNRGQPCRCPPPATWPPSDPLPALPSPAAPRVGPPAACGPNGCPPK
jgi:hypothetical protein